MKRTQLLKHLRAHGCVFIREGGSHSWWGNPNKIAALQFLAIAKSMTSLLGKSARILAFHSPAYILGASFPLQTLSLALSAVQEWDFAGKIVESYWQLLRGSD